MIERDRQVRDVRQLEGQVALPARIDVARRSSGSAARAGPASDFPSSRATRSSGSSTHSRVWPSTNSPGWRMNGSSSAIDRSSVRSGCGGPDVDVRVAVVAEDPEPAVEVEVDRRRLEVLGIVRVDPHVAGLERRPDVAIRQDAHAAGPRGRAPLGVQAVDLALELLEVLEALVDAGEADVGDLVDARGAAPSRARRHATTGTSVGAGARSSASIASAAVSAAPAATGRRVSALRRPEPACRDRTPGGRRRA